ncbi:MAG: SH3 domain-containing protein [Anaerolineae bacterium]|nr:SH3 domain-containing protein [Anaerolineae bacterium]
MKISRPPMAGLIGLVVLFLLGLVGTAAAATGSDLALSVGCAGFTSRGGSILFEDTDAVLVRAQDGAGAVLYERRITRPADGTFAWDDGERITWTTEPEFSPIVVSIVSEAETIAEQELVYLVVGKCTTLPSAGDLYDVAADLGLLALIAEVDGTTAPSVPPDVAPPRPTNNTDIVETLAGYAIVNTDNLFMRSGAGVEYTPVAVVDGGTRLIVLGRSDADLADFSDELWWYVEAGGLRGWVNNQFLALRGDLRGIPVVPSLGEIIAPTIYIGFSGSLMRVAPFQSANIVCGVQGDQYYPLLARDTRPANWYYVEATCVDGTVAHGWFEVDSVLLFNPADVIVPVFGE